MTPLFFKKVGLSFARTFLIVFVLGLIPVWDNVVNWDPNASKAALLAVIAAAGTAGIRAAQALFTTLETPPA
jgi:predicted ABC-type exoprotein transport system permease subunit